MEVVEHQHLGLPAVRRHPGALLEQHGVGQRLGQQLLPVLGFVDGPEDHPLVAPQAFPEPLHLGPGVLEALHHVPVVAVQHALLGLDEGGDVLGPRGLLERVGERVAWAGQHQPDVAELFPHGREPGLWYRAAV